MTRKEQIKEAAYEAKAKHIGYGDSVVYAFIDGALWADAHPAWISVDDELPPLNETFIAGFSDGEAMLVDFDNREEERQDYIETVKAFTHWMPMPAPPTCSEKPNNCKKGGEK